MSSPQPILATHKIEIAYHALGVDHKKQLYLNAIVDSGVASGYAAVTQSGTAHIDWTDCVDAYAALWKVLFGSADTIQSAILFEYSGGVYIPRNSHTLGVAGTGGSGGAHCNQVTFFGRSVDYDQWKDISLDTDNAVLDHGSTASLSGGVAAYLADFQAVTTTHIGNWVRSKSATFFSVWVSYTVSFNRKLRRNRGLV